MDRFEEAKQAIKDAVELVDLVQDYAPLTRRGRLFVARCPFHQERTPSFTVYPETQHFKCYGCGIAGDVFTFVMEREGMGFRDAMETLAERARVPLDGVFGRGGDDRQKRKRTDVHHVLDAVQTFFEGVLASPAGASARAYLERRGLLAPEAAVFRLGAHPAEPGRLAAFAAEKRLPAEVLAQAGLVKEDGHEPLRGRVTFAITDERGRVVGFGGRVLPDPRIPSGEDRRPKYLNSPESPFFNKRRLLYGLRQTKDAHTRRIVVVEGYTDVIACHVAGFTGAVATLGTALTGEHAKLLERYATEGVVLLFDGDRAGRQAADRAFRELVHTPLPVRIALLPEGTDPADLVRIEPGADEGERAAGRALLAKLIDGAEDALTMWFRLIRQRQDLTVDANVQRVAAECGRILAEVENLARREALRTAMARHLGLSQAAIEVPRARGSNRADEPTVEVPRRQPAAPVKKSKHAEAELDLLACVLRAPELVDDALGLPGDHGELVRSFLERARAARDRGAETHDDLVAALFGATCEDEQARGFLADAVERSARMRDARSMFSMLRRGRMFHYAKEEARRTRLALQQALADGDSVRADELTRKIAELLRRSTAPPA